LIDFEIAGYQLKCRQNLAIILVLRSGGSVILWWHRRGRCDRSGIRRENRREIETRFVIGLLLLKHTYGLSDEGVRERWVYDPHFQHCTDEEFFQHEFLHEPSDLSHWRKRLGDKLERLLAKSLADGA
jgi:hypothetical protein